MDVARTWLQDRRVLRVSNRRIFGFSVLVVSTLLMCIPTGMGVFRATEMAAVRDIAIISSMESQYFSQFGKYATSLVELGPPARGVNPGPTGADLIPASLAAGEKNGYVFTMVSNAGGFTVVASPKVFGSTGRRTFYLDQDGVVQNELQ